MSFGIYAVGYLILIAGVAYLASLDAHSAALYRCDCGHHAGNWRGYGCADYST
jgi:hypothetical protein